MSLVKYASIVENLEEEKKLKQLQYEREERRKEEEKENRIAENRERTRYEMVDYFKVHTEICDLHFKNLLEAKSIAGSKANEVARAKDIKCVGLIHGQGNHSEGEPILLPNIRALLERLAEKLNCKVVPGETLFSSFRHRNDFENNYGIIYFMNLTFYNQFMLVRNDIDWNQEKVDYFQDPQG